MTREGGDDEIILGEETKEKGEVANDNVINITHPGADGLMIWFHDFFLLHL